MQVTEKKISLKELKEEANNLKALSQVQGAIVKFFHLENWGEAQTKFGNSMCSERLLRFKVKDKCYILVSQVNLIYMYGQCITWTEHNFDIIILILKKPCN